MASHENKNESTGLTRREVLQLGVAVAATGLVETGARVAAMQGAPPQLVTSPDAKRVHDLSKLHWQLAGYMPYMARLEGALMCEV